MENNFKHTFTYLKENQDLLFEMGHFRPWSSQSKNEAYRVLIFFSATATNKLAFTKAGVSFSQFMSNQGDKGQTHFFDRPPQRNRVKAPLKYL